MKESNQKKISQLRERFLRRLRQRFPNMPQPDMQACAKQYSFRLNVRFCFIRNRPVDNAVAAFIRHRYTDYEELINSGISRQLARSMVSHKVGAVLRVWKGGNGNGIGARN